MQFSTKAGFCARLLLDSGVPTDPSCNRACDEGAEQDFAASACVVYDLEEAEAER